MNTGNTPGRQQPMQHAGNEHLYVVAYDIAAPQRWRKVFRMMEGYGE